MSDVTQQTSISITLKAACRYVMEKGNRFDCGPAYKGDSRVLSSVRQTVRWYKGMGYTKLLEFGEPPVYAVLDRGHREVHIFQPPPDPTIRAWLENDKAMLNDPAMRTYLLQKSGLDECDLPVASKPRYFHVNEVDNVFIATTDEAQ
ncbi:MAG TPA: hypothetical protein P5102_07480 [Candidatus Competibacteraceae bacterium]|nr:hypothetical protein [Candidatus Competibacteraceae bacterium]HSA46672.1 hypothetical protein [Candidatus Competibacteraceae bacterium]